MKRHSPIEDYVGELAAQLRMGARQRCRITAEVSDHFADLIAEEQDSGLSRREAAERAVARFGTSAELADEFNQDAARHGLRRAAWALVACVVVAFAAAGAANEGWAPARPWPNVSTFFAVTQLLVQVAIVCGLNGLFLAVVAPWVRGVPLAGRPAALAGRSLATAAVALVPVAGVAAANITRTGPVTERLLLTIVALGVPIAAYGGVRAATRASRLRAAQLDEDTLDVIAAVGATLAGRWPYAGRAHLLLTAAWHAARERMPRLTRWLDLRHHPWRTATTVSVAAGLALKAPDLLLQGDPDLLAAAVEAAAVFISFTALGGLLGLRGGRPHTEVEPDRPELLTI
jgi:hypothetical protein